MPFVNNEIAWKKKILPLLPFSAIAPSGKDAGQE
jgi:hypothetical protein